MGLYEQALIRLSATGPSRQREGFLCATPMLGGAHEQAPPRLRRPRQGSAGPRFRRPPNIHIVGLFDNYAEAEDAWRANAQRTVDDAEMKYVVVHLHRLLEPEA